MEQALVLAKRGFPVLAKYLPNSKLSNTYVLKEKSGRKKAQGVPRELGFFFSQN